MGNVHDHRRVFDVQGQIDKPGVAAGADPVERFAGDQIESSLQIGDAVRAGGNPTQAQSPKQVGVREESFDPVDPQPTGQGVISGRDIDEALFERAQRVLARGAGGGTPVSASTTTTSRASCGAPAVDAASS